MKRGIHRARHGEQAQGSANRKGIAEPFFGTGEPVLWRSGRAGGKRGSSVPATAGKPQAGEWRVRYEYLARMKKRKRKKERDTCGGKSPPWIVKASRRDPLLRSG